mmetsp:Transcript_20665/g.51476  ORF Transcript_20665/g.51476 Transcript_20665/m.51476 type:complete len:271 (-) Transcript_20665:234-1046(-)
MIRFSKSYVAPALPDLGWHEHAHEPLPRDDRHDDAHRPAQQVERLAQPRRRGQRHHQAPHAKHGHREEVRHQREWVGLQSAQQRDGTRRHGASQAQILEARQAHLLHAGVPARAEHLVQRVGQGVDGERRRGAVRVEGVHAAVDSGGVVEVRQRAQHGLHRHHVGERHRHATPRQRVPHVERVAQQHGAGRAVGRRRHGLVLHALELPLRHRLSQRLPQLLGHLRHDLGEDVLSHGARRHGGHLDVRGDIHQASHLLGADGVKQHGRRVA